MQSLATLDAIYSPEWEYRYYSYDSNWGEGEEMGSIRNGSGDTFLLFSVHMAVLAKVSHTSILFMESQLMIFIQAFLRNLLKLPKSQPFLPIMLVFVAGKGETNLIGKVLFPITS